MKQTVEEAAKEYIYKARASFVGITPEEYEEQINPEYPYNTGTDKDFESLFIAGADWQAKQSSWISVEDAIPNELAKGMCQVKYVDGSIDEMAMREVNKWIYPYIKTGYVTHWKPIPSFDEILEANKDVLERIKEKGD